MADAPTGKSKKTTKEAPAPTKFDTIILHIYSTITSGTKAFLPEDFIAWFKGSKAAPTPDKYSVAPPPSPVLGRWFDEGIALEFFTTVNSGVEDFKKSLQRKGAIVAYIGHSTLTASTTKNGPLGPALGLTPRGGKHPEIPNATLRTLLSKSAASLVIIAACDSKTAVGAISAGPPIIAQNSGGDRLTWMHKMANAVGTFLFLLIGWEMDGRGEPNDPHKGGHATINEALAATAADFDGVDDRFELVHGDGSIKLFPEKRRASNP